MVLADIIRTIHYLMFVYILFGPFILSRKYLAYYLFFVLFVFLDWNDFDGMCILTKLEYYFRYGTWKNESPIEGGPEFFRPFVNSLGFNLSRTEADRLNNFIFLIFWGIALIRYIRLSKC
jgi:hypothetical protein